MFYYLPNSSLVHTKTPQDYYEHNYQTFLPTREDLNEGFLVFFDYTSYDSLGPSDGISYEIIDLYETYESARKMAELIREYDDSKGYYRDGRKAMDIEKDFFYAATTDRKMYVPLGWGVSLKDIYIDEVKLVEPDDKVYRKMVF